MYTVYQDSLGDLERLYIIIPIKDTKKKYKILKTSIYDQSIMIVNKEEVCFWHKWEESSEKYLKEIKSSKDIILNGPKRYYFQMCTVL